MEIFRAVRGGGKTTLCVAWVKSVDNGLIVTHNEEEAARVRGWYGLGRQHVKARRDLARLLPAAGTQLAIDNVDLQLNLPHGLKWDDLRKSGQEKVLPERIYDLPVRLVTMTEEW